MAQRQDERSKLQWSGLCLGIAGVSLGIFMFIDIVIPETQEAIRSGGVPHFGLETNLKVLTPIVLAIAGFNMFRFKPQAEDDAE